MFSVNKFLTQIRLIIKLKKKIISAFGKKKSRSVLPSWRFTACSATGDVNHGNIYNSSIRK